MTIFKPCVSLAMATVFAFAASAFGQTNWIGASTTDVTDWHDATNWDNGEPNAVTDARFIDRDGNTVNLYGTNGVTGNLGIWGSDNMVFNADPGVTLTVNGDIVFGDSNGSNHNNNTSRVEHFNVDVIVTGTMIQYRKSRDFTFTRNVTVGGLLETPSNGWTFGDSVDDIITLSGGLSEIFANRYAGSTVTVNMNGTLVAPTVTVGTSATFNANSAKALGGDGGTVVTLQDGGQLYINTAQDTLGTINVGAYSLLAGDLTGANYASGGNVVLAEDAIVAPTAGPEPSAADLGSTKVWQGATTTATTAGDPTTTAYKGIAIGSFTPALNGGTSFTGSTGNDLNLLVVRNATTQYQGAVLNSDTGVANVQLPNLNTIELDSAFNGTAHEIHFINTGPTNRTVAYVNSGTISDGNEVHVQDGLFYINGGKEANVQGHLVFDGDAMWQLNSTNPIVPSAGTVITLNDNTALKVAAGQEAVLEGLTLESNLILNSTHPMVMLSSNGGGYDFTGAVSGSANPNMQYIMSKSDLVISGTNNDNFELNENLTIGNGRYLLNDNANDHKGIHIVDLDANAAGVIVAESGASSIGFANVIANNAYLDIAVPIEANGAKVIFGSTTPKLSVQPSNLRHDQIPAGQVWLSNGTIADTPEVIIESGTVRTDANTNFSTNLTLRGGTLNTNNHLVTVGGTLSGSGGTWQGNLVVSGHVAPGEGGVGTLSGGTLTVEDGGTYDWQIANGDAANGTPGTDWDLLSVSNLAFSGGLIVDVNAAGMSGSVTGSDEFIVATATNQFDLPTSYTVNAPNGWSGTGALSIVQDPNSGSWELVLSGLASSVLGDANGDGVVDAADYIILKQNLGTSTNAGAAAGDFNGDGVVDWADLQLLMSGVGQSGGTLSTIPEPATLGLLAFGGLALIRRRRRT